MRELTGGRGADLVFDFVGTDQSHADAMAMLARGGTYSIVGFGGMVTVPSAGFVGNEHTVAGNLVGTWLDLWEVMQLHAAGRLVLKTEVHPLDSVNEVLAKLATARSPVARCSSPPDQLWVRSVAGAAVSIESAAFPRSR